MKIAIFFLLFFCVTSSLFAFQFENFKWEMTLEDAKKIVMDARKPISQVKKTEVIYNDLIFNTSCKVTLSFTPESKCLNMVSILWQGNTVGQKALGIFSDKYGMPVRSGDLRSCFYWHDNTGTLTLDYRSMNTVLTYSYKSEQEKAQEDVTVKIRVTDDM